MPKTPTLIERDDGSVIGVNRRRLSEGPFFLLTNPPNNAVAMAANGAATLQPMTVSSQGPALIRAFAAQRTGPCRVMMQLQDGQSVQSLMNRSIHIDTIFGFYGAGVSRAFHLPESLYMDESRSLMINLTDISGSVNSARLDLMCARYNLFRADPWLRRTAVKMAERQYLSRPFFYTFDQGPVVVGANATVEIPIEVGQDHHFQLFKMSAVFTSIDFAIDIINADTGESLIGAPQGAHYPIRAALCIGDGSFPFNFHEPFMFKTKSRILVTLTDFSGAPNTIDLTLAGRIIALRDYFPAGAGDEG